MLRNKCVTLNNVNVYILGIDIELFSFLGNVWLKYCYRMNFAGAGDLLVHVRHLTLYQAAKKKKTNIYRITGIRVCLIFIDFGSAYIRQQ